MSLLYPPQHAHWKVRESPGSQACDQELNDREGRNDGRKIKGDIQQKNYSIAISYLSPPSNTIVSSPC